MGEVSAWNTWRSLRVHGLLARVFASTMIDRATATYSASARMPERFTFEQAF